MAPDSLAEVFNKVTARYREMTEQGECDVFSLVCGWNGFGFEGKTFFINSQFGEESRITDVRPEHEKDAKLTTGTTTISWLACTATAPRSTPCKGPFVTPWRRASCLTSISTKMPSLN